MQYPLGEHEREQIASKTGKKLDEITLDAVMRNQIAPDDIKISKDSYSVPPCHGCAPASYYLRL